MKTLTDTPGLTIVYDAAHRWLHVIWRGKHDEETVKAACLLVLDKIRQTKSVKILNDATQDQDGWGELTHWIAQDFLLALADAGVSAIAWVVSDNLRARIDTEKVMAHQTRPLVDTFADAESAYAWLQKRS